MTNDQEQGSDISNFFRTQEAGRHARVTRPLILDETAPTNPAAREAWQTKYDAAETAYSEQLMLKSACELSVEEKQFLFGGLGRYFRGDRR